MAQERISSLIDERVFKEIETLRSEIKSLAKDVQSFDLKLGDTSSMSEANGLLNNLEQSTNKLTKSIKAQTKAQEQLDRERIRDFKYQQQLEKQAKRNEKALLRIEAAKKREQQQIEKTTNDYAILSKAYQEAALKAKNYALTLGETNPITLQAIENANRMGDTLKRLDASVGQHQRNVGNYNMVGMQFNQILRELPNAGMGARMFLISISNNASYFVEAIKDARSSGASFRDILKLIGSQLFGVVGIINLAVLALTYWAFNANKSGNATDSLSDKIKELTDSFDDYIKKQNEATRSLEEWFQVGSRAQKRYIDLLKAQGATEQKLLDETVKYHRIRQSEIRQEMALYEDANKVVNRYIQAITIRPSDYNQASKELNDLLRDQLHLTDEQIKKERQLISEQAGALENNKIRSLSKSRVVEGVSLSERLFESRMELETKLYDEESAIEVAKAQFKTNQLDKYLREKEKRDEENLKKTKDAESKQFDMLITKSRKMFERRTEQYNQYVKNIEIGYLAQNKSLEQAYADDKITHEQYEKSKFLNTNTYNQAKLNAEIAYLKDVTNLVYDPATRAEMQRRLAEAEISVIEISNREKLKLYQEDEENRIKAEEEANKKILEDRNRLEIILRSISQIASEFLGMQSDRMQSRINALQREGEQIRQNGQDAINYIQASSLSEEEKQKAIREEMAKTSAAEKANEERRRMAAEQKARFDKQAAISGIILNTGVAIMKVWSGPGTWITKAIQTAAVAGISASQIARAQSAPLPQYEKGTLYHRGGDFIAGEKEKELVITPSGKSYWTNDQPTLYNEPRGTKVLNQDMIHSMLGAGLNASMARTITNKKEDITAKRIEQAIERTGKNTVRAITRNRAIQKVQITGIDAYYLKKVKGKA